MGGLRTDRAASTVIRGHALVQNLRSDRDSFALAKSSDRVLQTKLSSPLPECGSDFTVEETLRGSRVGADVVAKLLQGSLVSWISFVDV